jgi:hypothetical protein
MNGKLSRIGNEVAVELEYSEGGIFLLGKREVMSDLRISFLPFLI